MAELDRLVVRIEADIADLKTKLGTVQRDLRRTTGRMSKDVAGIDKNFKGLTRTVGVFRNVLAGLGATVGIAAIGSALRGTIGAFAEFEQGIIGVGKTTGLAGDELDALGEDIRKISRVVPVATKELLDIAQAAGQMGIKGRQNIASFTETIGQLTLATDLTGQAAASTLSTILLLTKTPVKEIGKVGSALVQLGNDFNATEAQITAVAERVARAGLQFGLGVDEVLALSTALKASGVNAEEAGSLMNRSFQAINDALRQGGKELVSLQKITGKTADELRKAFFQESPAKAFQFLIEGLGEIAAAGGDVTAALKELGLEGQRVVPSLSALAKNSDFVAKALTTSADAYRLNVALLKEVATASKSFNAQMTLVSSAVDEAASVLGAELAPVLLDLAVQFRDFLLAAKDSGALKVFAENAAAAFKVLIGVLKLAGIALAGLAFVKVRAGIIALGAAFVKAKNAIIPVLIGFRNVARVAPILATRLIAVEVAMGALALVGGPLGAILLAVGAGLAFMASESGKVRDKVKELDDEFKKLLATQEKLGKTRPQALAVGIDEAKKKLENLLAVKDKVQKQLDDLNAGIAVDTTLDIKTQTDAAERNIINLDKRINELVKKLKELQKERFELVGPKGKPDAPDAPGKLPPLEVAGVDGKGRDQQLKQIQALIDALTLQNTVLGETAAAQGESEEALRRLNAELAIHEALVGVGLVDAHSSLAQTMELVNSGANAQVNEIAKLIKASSDFEFAIESAAEAEAKLKEESEKLKQEQEELAGSFKALEADLDPAKAALEAYQSDVELLKRAYNEGDGLIPSNERLIELLRLLAEEYRQLSPEMQAVKDVSEDMAAAIAHTFEDLILGAVSFKDALVQLENQLLRILTQAIITGPLEKSLTDIFSGLGGGLLGSIFGSSAAAVNPISTLPFVPLAPGGRISGPGGPKSDAIPSLLSDGEFVVNADATRKNLALLEAINSGIPRLAAGGLVSPPINNIAAAPISRFADAPSRFGGERPINVNVTNHIAPGATQSDFRAATMDQASRFGRIMQKAMAENE